MRIRQPNACREGTAARRLFCLFMALLPAWSIAQDASTTTWREGSPAVYAANASRASYKASLIYRLSRPLELYASFGIGCHCNDACGEPAQKVTPLVPSRGAERGSRLFVCDHLNATLALCTLRLDSELLAWFPTERVSADLEASYSRARFTDPDRAVLLNLRVGTATASTLACSTRWTAAITTSTTTSPRACPARDRRVCTASISTSSSRARCA